MNPCVCTTDVQAAILAAVATAIPNTSVVRLSTTDINPTRTSVLADFAEPDGDWYDPATATFVAGEIHLNPSNPDELQVVGASRQYNWAAAGGALPVTIRSFFVTNADGTTLLASGRLATPVELNNARGSVVIVPVVRMSLRNAA